MNPKLVDQAAVDFVAAHPYRDIPDDVLSKLNAGAGNSILEPLVRNFNNSNSTMNFADLPPAAQTVIADIAYQWGPGKIRTEFASGKFWDAITGNDWAGAVRALNDVAKPRMPSALRYADDARLLETVVAPNGTLKNGR